MLLRAAKRRPHPAAHPHAHARRGAHGFSKSSVAAALHKEATRGDAPTEHPSAFEQSVGNTKLIRLRGPSEATGCCIYGKAEYDNP